MLTTMDEDELFHYKTQDAGSLRAWAQVAEEGRLPVVNFAAGGVATPADAVRCSSAWTASSLAPASSAEDPTKRAKAIVRAVAHYSDPKVLLETSTNLGKAMVGISDVKGDAVNGPRPRGVRGGPPARARSASCTATRRRGSYGSWKYAPCFPLPR